MNTSKSPVSPSTTRRRENTIEVSIRDLEQFFNTIDPSPFHEKDLDHDLEEFIVSWATEYPLNEPIRLVVHLQMLLPDTDAHAVIERAVHNYFAYKTHLNDREFRNLLRESSVSALRNFTSRVSGLNAVSPLPPKRDSSLDKSTLHRPGHR
jgi:hypothetical protein